MLAAYTPTFGRPRMPPTRLGVVVAMTIILILAAGINSVIPQGSGSKKNSSPAPRQLSTTSENGRLRAEGEDNEGRAARRIFVVGCGHSGTSLLFRSIGNMRGVRCLKKETALFVKNTGGDDRLRAVMSDWDNLARRGNYSAWVEKTPRHVHHLAKMFELDPTTRVIFIHRDGRDVAASFKARGYSWEKSVSRWVEDNAAAEPFLDKTDPKTVLAVGFEELTTSGGVLRMLRRVASFLELSATEPELALALLPGTRERQYQEYCTSYANDAEKLSDLAASLVEVLAGKEAPVNAEPSDEAEKARSATYVKHNAFRTWQMAQAWAEIPVPKERNLTREEERYFFGREDVRRLMKRFGYPASATADKDATE